MTEELALQASMKLPFYETKGIFTDHYLRKWIKDGDWWPKDKAVENVFVKCEKIISKRGHSLARYSNEAQTRSELIDKVLEALGFSFIPENPSPGVAKTTPDYLLFATETEKDMALSKDPKERYSHAFTLLEAKKYGHPLGAVSKKETPGRFPHNQIRDYLQDSCDSNGKPYFNWAILTNGAKWRLYNRNTPTSSFFEIDFEEILTSKNNFKYFYVLFHANAFQRDADELCRLDRLRNESMERQAELESNLRRRVYSLLGTLANGFYDFEPNEISEDQLDELYEACLIFLYRLLFVLYAEGRGLLPVKKHGKGSRQYYRNRYSLARFVEKLKYNYLEKGEDDFTNTYDNLTALFDLINGTDERLNKRCNVPLYNGGLFNPDEYQNLLAWKVGDFTLSRILKGLLFIPVPTRADQTDQIDFGQTIDYSDLEVRQLGSIYEGLLEYHLVLKDGKLELIPESKQRKSSGSYYTPDYVVKYIVNQTISPLIERIENSEEVSKGAENSFAKAVLKLRILDPAMGSGHFLVRATERLADEIAHHPTTGLAVDKVFTGESHDMAELAYWRGRVVESSIYGVDLNSLAVELAKLSLWLTCISSDQPLNFLDHHLRCGNSLVGTKIDELNSLPSRKDDQAELFEIKDLKGELKRAVESLSHIRWTASDGLASVKGKETEWKLEVHDRLAPFRAIADLRNSFEFGLKFDDATYREIAVDLMTNGSGSLSGGISTQYGELWENHFKLKQQYNYFHWELEFPDAFDDDDQQNGFDAVMGNPPYVLLQGENRDIVLLDYCRTTYPASAYKLDTYHLFIEKGIRLGTDYSIFSMITPANFLTNNYAKRLRHHIMKTTTIDHLLVINGDVFPNVSVDSAIFVFNRNLSANSFDVIHCDLHNNKLEKTTRFNVLQSKASINGQALFTAASGSRLRQVWDKIQHNTDFLGEIARVNFGKQLRHRKKYKSDVIELKPEDNMPESYKQCYTGVDVIKYYLKWGNLICFDDTIAKRGGCWDNAIQNAKRKIITRQIGQFPIFALDTKGHQCLNTVFMILLQSSDLDVKYVLGVLNSQLIKKYWMERFYDHRKTFPKIKGTYLKLLPIRIIDFTNSTDKSQHDRMVSLVEQMLNLHEQLNESSTSIDKDKIQKKIDDIDQEIDQLVYELYGLTDDEIELIEEKICF